MVLNGLLNLTQSTRDMKSILDISRLFSAGKFDQTVQQLSDNIEFHIYDDQKHLTGKTQVLEFCRNIAEYFASVETDFREHGHLVDGNKVVIYGYGEFKRNGQLINAVNSCDVYEFSTEGMLEKICSYCNAQQK